MNMPAVDESPGKSIETPRLRPTHSGLAPLWDRARMTRLLTAQLSAFQTGLLELKSIEAGALRFRDGWLEATYQLDVQATTEPEKRLGRRRFAWVLLDPGHWRGGDEAEYLLSPTDPALPETSLDAMATLEFLSRHSSIEESLLEAAPREIVTHHFGSRLVWRLSPGQAKGRDASVVAPDDLEVRISHGKPVLLRLEPPSGRELVAQPLLPLGTVEAGRTFVSVSWWPDAPSLHKRLAAAEAVIPFPEIGAALASFHRLGRIETDRPIRTLAGEIEQLKHLLRSARDVMEGVEEVIAPAIERLEKEAPPPAMDPRTELRAPGVDPGPTPAGAAGLVHGDLHDRRILFQARKIFLTGLDSASAGEAALDLGNLGAHLILRAIQWGRDPDTARRFVRLLTGGYRAAGGKSDPEVVNFYLRAALLRLALTSLFRLDAADHFPELMAAHDRVGVV